ncbi:NUDIX domain-containing protein [Rhodobacteraceae bacterium NNCM2]|nr:NUDIX domain-containing protein [Coraliihabitans acroporae]
MAKKRYGIISYLPGSDKKNVVLVTSRSSRKWIFPKGRRIPGKSRAASAKQEAYEEAGLVGKLDANGAVQVEIARKKKKNIQLTLYPMRVDKMLKRWPEAKKRKRIVLPCDKAERRLNSSEMRRSLKRWRKSR